MAKIVAIVGMPGSGKSTCAEYLKERGFAEVYFGGIVIDEVKSRGQEINEINERHTREDLRSAEGMAVMAKRSLPKIDKLLKAGHDVVIDDMYSFEEYKLLKSTYRDKFVLIAVTAPRRLRYDRLVNRDIRPLSNLEAESRDFAQIEQLNIGGSIAIADYYVNNNETVEIMSHKIEDIIRLINN